MTAMPAAKPDRPNASRGLLGGVSRARGGRGGGLAALIPQRAPQAAGSIEIGLDRISANPRQPRTRIDPAALATLAASIREHGVIKPILVTETIDGYRPPPPGLRGGG